MSQVVFIAVGLASLYLAYRWVRRDAERVEVSLRRMEKRVHKINKGGATRLTLDPKTGVYEAN